MSHAQTVCLGFGGAAGNVLHIYTISAKRFLKCYAISRQARVADLSAAISNPILYIMEEGESQESWFLVDSLGSLNILCKTSF